jgi:RNA recognition motif-containing protein
LVSWFEAALGASQSDGFYGVAALAAAVVERVPLPAHRRLHARDEFRPALHFQKRIENEMSTRLYVGNLSFRTTGDELREIFSQAGEVENATVVEDRDTGRSRGFGFVEMATAEGAAAAIEQFNGKEFGGRTLTVNEARPRVERGGYGGGGGRDREPRC